VLRLPRRSGGGRAGRRRTRRIGLRLGVGFRAARNGSQDDCCGV